MRQICFRESSQRWVTLLEQGFYPHTFWSGYPNLDPDFVQRPKMRVFRYLPIWPLDWPTCIVPLGANNNIVWQQWVSSVPKNGTLLKRKPRIRQSRSQKDVERAATTWLIYSPMAVEKILPFVSAQGQRLKAVLKDVREEGHFTHWLFCFTHKLNWAKETSALLPFSFSNDPLSSDSVKDGGLNRHLGYFTNWTWALSVGLCFYSVYKHMRVWQTCSHEQSVRYV